MNRFNSLRNRTKYNYIKFHLILYIDYTLYTLYTSYIIIFIIYNYIGMFMLNA